MSNRIEEIPFHHHPVDDIEPELPETEAYREAALRLNAVVEIIYDFVSNSNRPKMAIQQVGVALGIPAALTHSEHEFALTNQVTRQDFSKGVTKFLRMAQLPPSLALKSDAAKVACITLKGDLSFADWSERRCCYWVHGRPANAPMCCAGVNWLGSHAAFSVQANI